MMNHYAGDVAVHRQPLQRGHSMAIRFRPILLLGILSLLLMPRETPVRADDYIAKAYDKREPFGIVAALANRVRDDEQDAAVAMMKEAGVQWAREEISWDRLQPQQGG